MVEELAQPRYLSGDDLVASWEKDLWNGKPPERWPLGPGALARHVDFGPGLITLIGGPPGAGKTALGMSGTFDALTANQELRAVVVNVEMSANCLLDRQLSRFSGVPLNLVQERPLSALSDEKKERIRFGLERMHKVLPRVAFLRPPFSIEHLAMAADAFGAKAVLLDYIQRIAPPGEHSSQRESLEASMGALRQLADRGAGVLLLSAMSRQSSSRGSTYKGGNLASFRGSSELEFAADSAYLLPSRDSEEGPDVVTLSCEKRRHGRPRDVLLQFDRAVQRFTPLEDIEANE